MLSINYIHAHVNPLYSIPFGLWTRDHDTYVYVWLLGGKVANLPQEGRDLVPFPVDLL